MKQKIRMGGRFRVVCRDSSGRVKWEEDRPNLVVNAGLDDALDKYFKGSAYTAAHYVGLVDNSGFSTYAAADTMSSHGGWSESTAYSNAARPDFTPGTVSSQSVDNSASKASFSVNTSATIRGCFLTTDDTKGGSSGTLFSEVDFSASRSVQDGDTLEVTYTFSAADDGS